MSGYQNRRIKSVVSRAPIIPERVRRIDGQGFCFVPHRFLRDGFFASLSRDELCLYFFLLLASDRNGISFYRYDRICSVLQVPLERYLQARNGLIDKDLIAFDGTRFQVLSLPASAVQSASKPLSCQADFEQHDPATIRQMVSDFIDGEPDD